MGRSTQALNGLRQRFGENLIRLRNRVDLSQVETAKRSGLHLTEVSLLERGLRLPRLDTIIKLAGAIEAEPCELLSGMICTLAGALSVPVHDLLAGVTWTPASIEMEIDSAYVVEFDVEGS